MWPGPRPTFVPSGILIRPAVWQQQTWAENKRVVPPFWDGSWVPSNRMSLGPRPTSLPSGILILPAVWPQQIWAENWGGGTGSPSKTVWPGTRPTFVPSFILIHPTVGHNTQMLQAGQTETDNGPIALGEPFYKRSPNKTVMEWTSILNIFRSLTYSNITFTVADVHSWVPFGCGYKSLNYYHLLPPNKGYHIRIYAIDMGEYKNITRPCHLGWYQKVIFGGLAHGLLASFLFTDEQTFTVVPPKNRQNDWQNAFAATEKKDIAIEGLRTGLAFSHWWHQSASHKWLTVHQFNTCRSRSQD